MGCFLACFGSSKNKRCRKPPPVSSSPSPKFGSSYNKPVLQDLAPKRANVDQSVFAAPQSPGKQEDQLGAGIPKKVTFDDSNLRSHNSASKSVDNAAEISPEARKSGDEKVVVDGGSESGGTALSSLGSYPPNHRYHNCRESYNEDEMEEIDVDDYDVDKDAVDEAYDSPDMNQEWTTPGSFSSMESMTKTSTALLLMSDLDGIIDGSTQVVETKTSLLAMPSVKSKDEQEHVVDASLSRWLVSSQKTPANKATARGLEAIPSEASASSHGSNSVRSFNDRPILGALTMEELKHVLASSSPQRSPSQNADDRPIIGSVGSHWSEETPSVQPDSVSSFKGIPNTTSKYREDKKVNWHSTPFETRLEQALKKGVSGVPF